MPSPSPGSRCSRVRALGGGRPGWGLRNRTQIQVEARDGRSHVCLSMATGWDEQPREAAGDAGGTHPTRTQEEEERTAGSTDGGEEWQLPPMPAPVPRPSAGPGTPVYRQNPPGRSKLPFLTTDSVPPKHVACGIYNDCERDYYE